MLTMTKKFKTESEFVNTLRDSTLIVSSDRYMHEELDLRKKKLREIDYLFIIQNISEEGADVTLLYFSNIFRVSNLDYVRSQYDKRPGNKKTSIKELLPFVNFCLKRDFPVCPMESGFNILEESELLNINDNNRSRNQLTRKLIKYWNTMVRQSILVKQKENLITCISSMAILIR